MPAGQEHLITDRARKHKDGSVLLSIAEDSVCRLNGVGALTWTTLEDTRDGLSLNEIVRALEHEFAAINAEGELLYEVPHEQLQTDTDRFLKKMVSLGLLQRSRDGFYSVSEDVTGTTSAPATDIQQSNFAGNDVAEDLGISRRETFSAFVGLLAFDLLLKFGGFQKLIRKVARWPIAEPHHADREVCRHVRGMVDRAQLYYPKKAMCLQHSAVMTCLLRRRGVPAEMVLAAQTFPPKAHAWAEVAGEVVNDQSSVKSEYRVLKRI
ncbi:MAG TPA: lasso peptide biosynthesis B2 protein [Pyrinomonadaceae bacterium]|nr:lasso peptide biosynthesis B2 protein [Pyrinomonadaceae bacterium]